jgi:hypothetical protein
MHGSFFDPAKYAIDKLKPYDIVLEYAGDEENPIVGYVFVALAEKAKLFSHLTAENQIHLFLKLWVCTNVPKLLVPILLIEPVPGPSPRNDYSLWIQSYQTR